MVNTVHNLSIPLKKGYMVVKCRGQKEIAENVPVTEAIKREDAFFRNHAHFQQVSLITLDALAVFFLFCFFKN